MSRLSNVVSENATYRIFIVSLHNIGVLLNAVLFCVLGEVLLDQFIVFVFDEYAHCFGVFTVHRIAFRAVPRVNHRSSYQNHVLVAGVNDTETAIRIIFDSNGRSGKCPILDEAIPISLNVARSRDLTSWLIGGDNRGSD